jgi:RimJ/RimL family protein N-acetyltransferase
MKPSMSLTPLPLQGRIVRLEPLAGLHKAALRAACEADPDIWLLYPINMAGDGFDPWWTGVEQRVQKGVALAYAILNAGEIVGCSLFSIDAPNRRVEIGNTYLHPSARGGFVNPDTKRAMLAHAFDSGAICVQFKVDALNLRSRAAVTKLGARKDGVLRASRITWTGRVRDTVVFSIVEKEWPSVRDRLDSRLDAFD